MKKILVVVVALASMNAFATRARVNALGNSPHLIDTQTVFSNPADMMMMGDYVTMESGVTGAAAQNGNAEGMVTRSLGSDAKMGLALGHQSANASAWSLRALSGLTFAPGTAMKSQQNPVEFSYGMKSSDLAWAATLVYSNYNDKTATAEKESSMGIRTGLRMGALDAKLNLGLMNTYENAAAGKFKGNLGITAGAGYAMDNLYVSAEATMVGFKSEDASGTEIKDFSATTIKASAVSSHKKEGNEFFYGAGLTSASSKDKVGLEQKSSSLVLPVWMGLEVDAASWLTLRGSVTQNTLVNSSKTENTTGTLAETAPGANSTVASVGAGMKWNKLTLDGSLSGLSGAGASQKVDGTDLLGQVGVTYMF